MGLSKEEKEALAEHYRDKDLYDPSMAPEQDTSAFEPEAMCNGGEMGYAGGGIVQEDPLPFGASDYSVAPSSGTAQGFDPSGISLPVPDLPQPPAIQPKPQMAAPAAARPTMAAPQPQAAPMASPDTGKLSPDQFDALIKGLQPSMGNRLAQGIASGGAGFADAVLSGVAGAPGPGFQRNLEDSWKNKREDMINALKAKYETKYKGQELSQNKNRLDEETRHNRAMETESSGRLGEERRSHDLENAQRQDKEKADMLVEAEKLPSTGILHPSTWGRGAEIEKTRENLLRSGLGQGGGHAPMTATNKMGHKIMSVDGGKTWKPVQ